MFIEPLSISELTEAMRRQSERAVRLYLEAMECPDAKYRSRPQAFPAARREGDAEAIRAAAHAEAQRARDRDRRRWSDAYLTPSAVE